MTLSKLFQALEHTKPGLVTQPHISDQEIHHIAYDSQKVEKNTLFICKGAKFHEKYLQQAKEQGAVCYVAERKFDLDMDYILVSDLRLALGVLVEAFFNHPQDKLSLIGITGTKGKTTTSMFLRGILDAHMAKTGQKPSGLLCSVLTYDGVAELPSRLTTKEPIELNTHLKNAIESGISHLTMEVSSQAVKYHRIYGLHFDVGCYLNIGEDHISPQEHPDFQDYFQSKLDFFKQCKAVSVHLDGVHTDKVLEAVPDHCKLITCSRQDPKADYYVERCEKRGISSVFTVKTPHYVGEFQIDMAGLFNVDNALTALSVADFLGVPQETIAEGLLAGRAEGRMEFYRSANEKISILVDYAHNAMSFQAIFSSVVEEFPNQKIVAVFGCPGEKALDRRADMGKIADSYADYSFLTEDDPGNEPIYDICVEIGKSMPKGAFEIQENREKAIESACNLYPEEEKIVLLLGKGAETDQKRGNFYVENPSDAQLALAFLKAYDQLNP